MEGKFTVSGQLVDIEARTIYPANIYIADGIIQKIEPIENAPDSFLLPGFIDAHVHIESSMLVPSEFARLAVVHGTVATVSDPHEIANVCGIDGVNFMIEDGEKVNFKFFFGAPSCVPATPFETSGASLDLPETESLLQRKEIFYLAEMMNWPGVIHRDKLVMEKIQLAKKYRKSIDGHAPGLMGEEAEKYASAGISTDHECFTIEEAISKINFGMKIAIREGSAAKNFDDLIDLMDQYADRLMFCSDDKHPDSLELGHINQLAARAVKFGKDLFDVLKVACLNPIDHYQLPVGRLKVGDPADFIMVKDLKDFKVQKTYINGKLVAENGNTLIKRTISKDINHFNATPIKPQDLALESKGKKVRVIEARDRQLITKSLTLKIKSEKGLAVSDPDNDMLKIVVINRYSQQPPSIAFIKNFGIKNGAIGSSVAHDSHNIIAVGVTDQDITGAINLIIKHKGGLSAVNGQVEKVLPLPIGGLMSDEDGFQIAKAYTALDQLAKALGSKLQSPYMTLSFMALLVIPELKLSDKGLFDGKNFKFTNLFTE